MRGWSLCEARYFAGERLTLVVAPAVVDAQEQPQQRSRATITSRPLPANVCMILVALSVIPGMLQLEVSFLFDETSVRLGLSSLKPPQRPPFHATATPGIDLGRPERWGWKLTSRCSGHSTSTCTCTCKAFRMVQPVLAAVRDSFAQQQSFRRFEDNLLQAKATQQKAGQNIPTSTDSHR